MFAVAVKITHSLSKDLWARFTTGEDVMVQGALCPLLILVVSNRDIYAFIGDIIYYRDGGMQSVEVSSFGFQ